MRIHHAVAAMVLLATTASGMKARAADFDWTKFKGQTISFLANNNAVGNVITANKAEFEKLTGMTVKVDTYQEQQMRQRLVTILDSRSDETDVYMTLVSREGLQFEKAGWYVDLAQFKGDTAPDYDLAGISPALTKAATIEGKLTSIPTNIEGPVIYYRKDVFAKCGVTFPDKLEDLPGVAQKIKACDPSITPFVSRGLRDALAYTFSNVVHNMGGNWMQDGKPALCSAPDKAAITLYAGLLKDYGPPGVVNYSFNQIDSIYRTGRAAIAFEASNELGSLVGEQQAKTTGVKLLPPGPGGSVPTGIGWGLSISPFSKKQEQAWYMVQWATSPAMQAKFALAGVAAPREAVAQSPEVKAWIAAEPVRAEWQAAVDGIARDGSSEVGFPIVANPASRTFIGQPVDDLLLGTKTVDAACADADHGMDGLIAGN